MLFFYIIINFFFSKKLKTEAYDYFFEFLKQEYSEENLLFISEVNEYKKLHDVEQRKPKAEYIYEKYIKQQSASEVFIV